jgi:hypothetical protein
LKLIAARKLLKQTAVPSLHLKLGPLSQNPSPSPEEENQIPSPQTDIPASPELVEQARKRVSNIIVVDLIKDKRIKLNHSSEVSQSSVGFK